MNEGKMITMEPNIRVLDGAEQALWKETGIIEQRAQQVNITGEESYAYAGEMVKLLKAQQKKVVEFFEPMRVSAKTAYDQVLSRKKEMLDPLTAAERILKRKMGDFVAEMEAQRRAREEAARRAAALEMERKLAEAVEAERAGDAEAADFAMVEAEILEEAAHGSFFAPGNPKLKGVSTGKAWRITDIDAAKVPIEFAGAILRPVDEKAVLSLIKASKGKIRIPGITFEEDVTISVRV